MRNQQPSEPTSVYRIAMTGRDIYGLLTMIERFAVSETCYLTVRDCVFYSEKIRTQATRQGWGRDLPRIGEASKG